jgi:hypothetical protein
MTPAITLVGLGLIGEADAVAFGPCAGSSTLAEDDDSGKSSALAPSEALSSTQCTAWSLAAGCPGWSMIGSGVCPISAAGLLFLAVSRRGLVEPGSVSGSRP